MFERYIKKPKPEVESEHSDEDLLSGYRSLQEDAARLLRRGGTKEWWGFPPTPRESRRFTERVQQEAESMLAKLNVVREEIEKRGLKAPTLEEREEKGDFEDF